MEEVGGLAGSTLGFFPLFGVSFCMRRFWPAAAAAAAATMAAVFWLLVTMLTGWLTGTRLAVVTVLACVVAVATIPRC